MAENQADPESIGAGPPNAAPLSMVPRMQRDRQSFLWSRVHLSHDSHIPPPRSGAASVVVQGKLYMFGVSEKEKEYRTASYWFVLELQQKLRRMTQ